MRTKYLNLVPVIAGTALCSASPVIAQSVQEPVVVEPGPVAASSRFITATKGVTASLDISEEESKAEVAVGGSFFAEHSTSADRRSQDELLWKIGAELPVGGKSNLLDKSTLDFLSGGVTFSGALTWTHSSSRPDQLDERFFEPHIEEARQACLAKRAANDCSAEFANNGLKASSLVLNNLPDLYERLVGKSSRRNYDNYWIIGLKGSVGIKDFYFTTPGTLAESKDGRESYSTALSFTYFPRDRVSAFTLEAEYSNAYEAADETIVCKTVIITPADDCVTASPTGPTLKEHIVLRGEYRNSQVFSIAGRSVGLGLSGSVDTLSGDIGVEMPLYFDLGSSSPFLPGVKLGYSRIADKPKNDNEDFTIALFLKTSFGF